MRAARSRLALLVLAAVSVLATGCDRKQIARWCEAYQRGYAYVDAIVLPALVVASSSDVAPEWTPAFKAARSTLLAANATLAAACERARAGAAPNPREVGDLVAQGAEAMQELIRLHHALRPEAAAIAAGTRAIRGRAPTPVEVDSLLGELEALEFEARRSQHKRK